jgi:hypothetical protein
MNKKKLTISFAIIIIFALILANMLDSYPILLRLKYISPVIIVLIPLCLIFSKDKVKSGAIDISSDSQGIFSKTLIIKLLSMINAISASILFFKLALSFSLAPGDAAIFISIPIIFFGALLFLLIYLIFSSQKLIDQKADLLIYALILLTLMFLIPKLL